MALLSLAVVVVAVIAYVVLKKLEASRKDKAIGSASKLPGPKGLPIIGNVHELPEKCNWMKFAEWAEEYGPIYQVNLAGSNHVWIARDKIAHDLLSKRSAIYSDRPSIPALEHDNRTSGQYLPLMSKNLVWSRQRRFAKQIMDKSEHENFYQYPEIESVRLLFELMTDPSSYNHAMESFVARVTSRLAWGTPDASEELKQRARELLIGVSPTGALGNKLPAVMSLPEKLSQAKAWELRRGRTERKFFETMQQNVRAAMHTDSDKQSWTRMYLEHQKSWGFSGDTEGAYAVGMHGIAGALTIAAPMQSFCLAMVHFPQYQSILHEEIDRVLGDRMPTFDDMPEMPVLRAFIRETLRWRPPVPTGIPHEVTQDDVYEGYHIPKGSVIHPLEWSISRDPEVFPQPDDWNPTRWLHSDYPTYQEPLTRYPTITNYSQFGYGRRTCQGMGVTEADLFVGLGSVAWLFSMSLDEKAEDQPEAQPEAQSEPTSHLQTEAEAQSEVQDDAQSETQDDFFTDIGSTTSASTPASRRSTFSFDGPTDLMSFENGTSGEWSPRQKPKRISAHFNDSAISLLSHDSPKDPRQLRLGMHENDSAISVNSFAPSSRPVSRHEALKRPNLDTKDSAISMSFVPVNENVCGSLSRHDTVRQGPFSSVASINSLIEMQSPTTSHHRMSQIYSPDSALSLLSEMEEEDDDRSLSRQSSMLPEEPVSPTTSKEPTMTVAGEWPGLSTDPEKEYVNLFGPLIDEPELSLPFNNTEVFTPELPGSWNFPAPVEGETPEPTKKQTPAYETDPTMNFSTLLIAKPMPFRFKLQIRNQARAEMIARQWIDRKMEGEYGDAKVYWKNGVKGDAEHGWGETFS